LSQDNVVFTPHIAFYSNEALKRILDTTLENIADFQAGKLRHAVEV
jgi:lactate dehydrogenase-like 2-hydroxyacid dehydrogenase